MAIIPCPNCKENISDKSIACVHCGFTLRSNSNTPPKEEPLPENRLLNYSTLTAEQQLALEIEFVNNNKKANNLYRLEKEINSYKKLSSIGFTAFAFIFVFIFIAVRIVPLDQVYSENLMSAAVALWLILLASSIALVIASAIMRKIYNKSLKAYHYLKLYQIWLLKEKKIQFTPVFPSFKEKEIFDNINISDIK